MTDTAHNNMAASDALHDDMLMDHEYDGIREYDNPLPSWWTWLWAASMFFSVGYWVYYHVGVGPTVEDKYQWAVAAQVEKLLAQLGDIQADNATILAYKDNQEWMSATKGMFIGNCAQCHNSDGGGNVGPNLTDDVYKNVKEPKDIFRVITEGVPEKGMQAWGDRLSEPQRILLAAYVASLRGTTPAVAKQALPEERRIPAWDTFDVTPAAAPEDGGAEPAVGAGAD